MWELKQVDLIEVVITRSWFWWEEVVGRERIVNQQGAQLDRSNTFKCFIAQ